jgi:hypothetical protein
LSFHTIAWYRGSRGILEMDAKQLCFKRTDGRFFRTERLIACIPLDAVISIDLVGVLGKRIVVTVDSTLVAGIPCHEFLVGDPVGCLGRMRAELESSRADPFPVIHTREIVREVVKVPCAYCGSLNLVTSSRCDGCGAPVLAAMPR